MNKDARVWIVRRRSSGVTMDGVDRRKWHPQRVYPTTVLGPEEEPMSIYEAHLECARRNKAQRKEE